MIISKGVRFLKKFIAIILLAAMTFTLFGCGYSVPQPMPYPDYTFESTPDTDQLRATAVQAVHDFLTIQWHTEKEIKYKNNGADHKKIFEYTPGNAYGGLFYATANTGIFQFFEFYDSTTGSLRYNGTADELKLDLGSTCASSLLWGWLTVCNSITGGFHPVLMVPKNGYLPVGNYTIPDSINSYHEMPTYEITKMNSKDAILDAYTKTLPADILISTPDDHAMLVCQAPTVVYTDDNTIDMEASYLLIHDQWTGGTEEIIDNVKVAYNGRLSKKFTFAELYDKDYIPLTAAEFTGAKHYDKAQVAVSNATCNNINELSEQIVTSNYPLAVVNLINIDKSGEQTVLCRQLFRGFAPEGVPKEFSLSKLDLKELSPEAGSTIKLEVVVSTGERFYPIEFTV